MALRGDSQAGVGGKYVPREDGYRNAVELVAGLKAIDDFEISVSAYPEKHPESSDFATDIDLLKRKVDNGATRAITQFFFDNDIFERYVERVRRAGIYIPIVPGIVPIHDFTKVARFSNASGAKIPSWLAERFDGLEEDPQTRSHVAAAFCAEQVLDLTRRGISDFHFYTMNRADLVYSICHILGMRAATAAAPTSEARRGLNGRTATTSSANERKPGQVPGFLSLWGTVWRPSDRMGSGHDAHHHGSDECKHGTDHQQIQWTRQFHLHCLLVDGDTKSNGVTQCVNAKSSPHCGRDGVQDARSPVNAAMHCAIRPVFFGTRCARRCSMRQNHAVAKGLARESQRVRRLAPVAARGAAKWRAAPTRGE